ncbi:MAG: hypothetical protein WKF58_00245 [Ilumatobacteraceae bacterium]
MIVFGFAFTTYSLIDLPGAAPLALLAALASTVPVVGLLLGVVPAVGTRGRDSCRRGRRRSCSSGPLPLSLHSSRHSTGAPVASSPVRGRP